MRVFKTFLSTVSVINLNLDNTSPDEIWEWCDFIFECHRRFPKTEGNFVNGRILYLTVIDVSLFLKRHGGGGGESGNII